MRGDDTLNWMLEALLNADTLTVIRFLWFRCFSQHLNIKLKLNFPSSALRLTTMSEDMPEAQIPEDLLETQEKQETGEIQQWDTGQNDMASGSVQQKEEDLEQKAEEQRKEKTHNTEDQQNVLEQLHQEVGETEERQRDQKTVQQQQTEERGLQQVSVHREGEQAEKKNQDGEELHQTKMSWTREEEQQTNLEQLTKVVGQQKEMERKEWQDTVHTLEQNQNHQVLFRLKGV